MDSISEKRLPRQNITHGLVEQIRIGLDGSGKSPKVELLTAGADSHIYLIKPSEREPLIAKLYDVSPVTSQQVQEYADKTNFLKSSLEKTPYLAEAVLHDEPWVTKFTINEVLWSGVVEGLPYTVSPFIPGEDFEQMAYSAKSERSKPYILVPSDSGTKSPFAVRDILELHQQTFDLNNPDRLELDFNKHINSVLGATHFNVQPLNLKLRVNINNRSITFLTTDIAGNVAKAIDKRS